MRKSSQKAEVETFLRAVKKGETSRQPRKPSEVSQYAKMFWDDRIKSVIEEEMAPIEADLQARQARGEKLGPSAKKSARMKIQPTLIKQLYENEDEETKAQVRASVQQVLEEQKAEAVHGLGDPQTPEDYNRYVATFTL